MSLIIQNTKVSSPEYFHREYENDFSKDSESNPYFGQAKRIVLVALPFLSLYKPLSFSLSLALGGLRSIASISQLLSDIQNHGVQHCSYPLLSLTISIGALAGTLLAHPLGILITSVHDCVIESFVIGTGLLDGDLQTVISGSVTLLNNTLYLALFFHGGVEIVIASLAMQALIGVSNAFAEYQKENYLEAGGHLLMGMIRGNQLLGQVRMIQARDRLNKISQSSPEELNSTVDSIFKESTVENVDINVQKLNPTVVEALKVEWITWNGALAQVALYVDNISVITLQGGLQSIYMNGAHLVSTGIWVWETVNGVQYSKHIYDDVVFIYSTDWSQYIVYS